MSRLAPFSPRTIRRLASAAVLVAAAVMARPAGAQGFVIIVNAATPVTSLTADQVSKIFLRKQTAWSGGGLVTPIDLVEDSPTRAAFSSGVLHRPVSAIKAYWQQQIFSGRDVPPAEKTEDDAIASVRSTPGAIAYVSAGADTKGVHVVPIH